MRKSILSLLLSGASAFSPPSRATPRPPTSRRVPPPLPSTVVSSESSSSESSTDDASPKNQPAWDVKQHLYGLDMINEMSDGPVSVTIGADGKEVGGEDGLPLPETYITCGKCKSLFAIAEADLGEKGKGCRVKCSVCSNSWYQSRDRLFDIPTSTHDLLPAHKSDLDRIARNLARDISPAFGGVSKLYVGNLDWSTDSDDLLGFFEDNAPGGEDAGVCDVSVISGPDGRSRGFAFVTFYDEGSSRAALGLDGMDFNGRQISVREPNN